MRLPHIFSNYHKTMATHYIKDLDGRVNTIITMADIYEYKGFTFEVHRYCGPCKLKKDWTPAAAMGRKFWRVWSEWDKLTKEEKAATQISG
jgi:hypothetical protein